MARSGHGVAGGNGWSGTAVGGRSRCGGAPVVVVNPFATSPGPPVPQDRRSRCGLAHFADAIRPEVRPLRDAESQVLNSLTARRRQVLTMLVSEKNRLGTAISAPYRLVGTGVERLGQGVKAVSASKSSMAREGRPSAHRSAWGSSSLSPCWPTSPSWALWTAGRSRPWWACALQPGQRHLRGRRASGADAPGFGVFSTWGR